MALRCAPALSCFVSQASPISMLYRARPSTYWTQRFARRLGSDAELHRQRRSVSSGGTAYGCLGAAMLTFPRQTHRIGWCCQWQIWTLPCATTRSPASTWAHYYSLWACYQYCLCSAPEVASQRQCEACAKAVNFSSFAFR